LILLSIASLGWVVLVYSTIGDALNLVADAILNIPALLM